MFKDLSRNLEVNKVNIKIRGGLLGILLSQDSAEVRAEDSAEALESAEVLVSAEV